MAFLSSSSKSARARSLIAALFDRLARLQVQRPFVPITIAFVLAAVGALLATKLELRTRFDQLLPDHQRSVVELRRVMAETDARTNVFVVLEGGESASTATLRAMGDALVPRLREVGRPWVASAGDGVQEPRAFLSPRAGLFLSLPELERLRSDVTRRWDWEVAQRMNAVIDDEAPEPPKITGEELKRRFKGDVKDEEDDDERFPEGYYQSKDGKTLVVIAHTEIPAGELEGARDALARIQAAVDEVHGGDAFTGVKVGYAGDLVTGLAEYGAVKDDLVSTGALGVGLVLTVVLLFFMRLRALFVIGLTIATGLAWTFGLTQLAIGHLNVATGFLFSIVAGNGINFGIIYLARYFEERREEPARGRGGAPRPSEHLAGDDGRGLLRRRLLCARSASPTSGPSSTSPSSAAWAWWCAGSPPTCSCPRCSWWWRRCAPSASRERAGYSGSACAASATTAPSPSSCRARRASSPSAAWPSPCSG